jgi:hypothetical protein
MLKIFGVMIIFVSPSNRLQVAAVERPSQTDALLVVFLLFGISFPVDSSCSLSSWPNVVNALFSLLSDRPSLGFIHVALTDCLLSLHSLKKGKEGHILLTDRPCRTTEGSREKHDKPREGVEKERTSVFSGD